MKIKTQLLILLLASLFMSLKCNKNHDNDDADDDFLRVKVNGAVWEANLVEVNTTGTAPDNDPVEVFSLSGTQRLSFHIVTPAPGDYALRPGDNEDVLPATLISFTAGYEESAHKLEWETASEVDLNKFIVEVSANGTDWAEIGTVNAKGIASTYEFLIQDIGIGDNIFYRLKMMDNNSQSSYSSVRSLNTLYHAVFQPLNDMPRRGYDGSLHISTLDRSRRIMTGTFFFKVKSTDGTLHTLTDGEFRVHY